MTSERVAYIFVQLPGTLDTVPAALLKVEKLPDGTFVGRFRYGDRYLERKDAIAFDPFQLPLGDTVQEFTRLRGIPGAVRDAGPDAWGRRETQGHDRGRQSSMAGQVPGKSGPLQPAARGMRDP